MAELQEVRIDGEADDSPELSAVDRAYLEDCFLYHAPDATQRDALFEVNASAKDFAQTILKHVKGSADRSAALRAVREAKMWANSGIVLEGRR